MSNIDGIPFSDMYSYVRQFLLLLYDRPDPQRSLELNKAHQLTCLRPFLNVIDYQNYITHHNPEKITLFTSVEKITNWDANYLATPEQLHHLHIYCETLSQHVTISNWNERNQWKNKRIVDSKYLDFELLLAAGRHIGEILHGPYGADEVREDVSAEGERICRLMSEYFANCGTRQSVEVQEILH